MPLTRRPRSLSRCFSLIANRAVRIGSTLALATLHLRFNDLSDPEPVPRDTSYASLIESTVPIIVQQTGLDSRNPNIALLSTIAFPHSSSDTY
jgi:hypothetical protein